MGFLFDFFPVFLFFGGYFLFDIYVATALGMAATAVQVAVFRLKTGRFEKMHLISFFAFCVFGGATLLFHNESFIQWKVTVVNWLMALVCFGLHLKGINVIKSLMSGKIHLPERVWSRLNLSWVVFFVAVGAINIWVAYRFDLDTWVYFKFFGVLGLTLLMTLAQIIFISRYVKPAPSREES